MTKLLVSDLPVADIITVESETIYERYTTYGGTYELLDIRPGMEINIVFGAEGLVVTVKEEGGRVHNPHLANLLDGFEG